jgi:CYTH domain-containing protein
MEIERKFLVKDLDFLINNIDLIHEYSYIEQLYLSSYFDQDSNEVRIRKEHRLFKDSKSGFIVSKSPKSELKRKEKIINIGWDTADYIFKRTSLSFLWKYRIYFDKWEIDLFQEPYEGLVIAEYELENEDEQLEVPWWVLKEVTGNELYYNSHLAFNNLCFELKEESKRITNHKLLFDKLSEKGRTINNSFFNKFYTL